MPNFRPNSFNGVGGGGGGDRRKEGRTASVLATNYNENSNSSLALLGRDKIKIYGGQL